MPKEVDTSKLSEDIEIDSTDLHGELARQPSRYFYWGSTWARAEAFAKKMRVALKETEARIANNFRAMMAKENPTVRVTDSIVQGYLRTHDEVHAAEEAVRRAEYTADLLEVAREAFKQRHHSLQKLVMQKEESDIYGNEFQQVKAMRDVFEDRERRRAKED